MNIQQYIEIAQKDTFEFDNFRNNIFPIVMKWEGGSKLHKVKHDSGGWTKWGITWNNWARIFDNFEDFKDTTLEEAAAFAYVRFYKAIQADKMPDDTKLYYFDMAYNMGSSRAIKIMQQCAGVKADGIIGPITRRSMLFVTEECLKYKRDTFYNRLVERNYKLGKFLKGWLNRSNAIYNYN